MTQLQLLAPHARDLGGGFTVRRLLPSIDRRAVGPFVFFDHFGPLDIEPGAGHDVRPHPHIGLSTLTYLFEGAMVHRDSTGIVQRIEPGAVNWMSAGRGIVHSERTPKDLLDQAHRSHGLQFWVALPEADEDSAPSFQHVAAAIVPQVRLDGASARVVVGSAFGVTSPVATRSPTLAVVFDFAVASGASIELPALASQGNAGPPQVSLTPSGGGRRGAAAWGHTELALYAVDHPFEIDGTKVDEFTMAVLAPGTAPRLAAPRGGRVVLVGGEPLGHRFVSWNFVSSRRERIAAAEADWVAQRFARIPGETEFIPLPARRV